MEKKFQSSNGVDFRITIEVVEDDVIELLIFSNERLTTIHIKSINKINDFNLWKDIKVMAECDRPALDAIPNDVREYCTKLVDNIVLL